MPRHDFDTNTISAALTLLTDHGFDGLARPLEMLFNEAMRLERSPARTATRRVPGACDRPVRAHRGRRRRTCARAVGSRKCRREGGEEQAGERTAGEEGLGDHVEKGAGQGEGARRSKSALVRRSYEGAEVASTNPVPCP